MAVWPILMALSVGVVAVAAVARDRPALHAGCAILSGYLGGRLIQATSWAEPDRVLAFAVLWLGVAILVGRIGTVRASVASVLLTLASLCYLWARLTAAPWVVGSIPFVVSDVLAVAAMVTIGSGAVSALVGRIVSLGRTGRGGGLGDCRGRDMLAPSQTTQENGPR